MNLLSFFKFETLHVFQTTKWLPLASSIAILSTLVGPIPYVAYIQFPLFIIGVFFSLKNKVEFDIPSLLLLLYLPVSLIINDPDPLFQSWPRLGLFLVLFVLVSPFLKSQMLAVFRKKVLFCTLFFIMLFSFLSFFAYYMGINYMTSQADGSALGMDKYMGSGGSFGGMFYQSIVLGFGCGLSILYLIYRALKQNKDSRLSYWLVIAVLFITLLLSASRSALIACIASSLVLVYYSSRSSGNFIKVVLCTVFMAAATFPLWEDATQGLMKKQEGNDGSVMNSRSFKWNCRIAEFNSSPITGIGFASIDPNGGDLYIKSNGQIEPGNTWLSFLSMTGIVGFLLIVIIISRPIKYLRRHPTPYNSLLLALFMFFTLHFMSEGYGLAGGSALCMIAWLVFGCCNDATYADHDNEDL